MVVLKLQENCDYFCMFTQNKFQNTIKVGQVSPSNRRNPKKSGGLVVVG